MPAPRAQSARRDTAVNPFHAPAPSLTEVRESVNYPRRPNQVDSKACMVYSGYVNVCRPRARFHADVSLAARPDRAPPPRWKLQPGVQQASPEGHTMSHDMHWSRETLAVHAGIESSEFHPAVPPI